MAVTAHAVAGAMRTFLKMHVFMGKGCSQKVKFAIVLGLASYLPHIESGVCDFLFHHVYLSAYSMTS